MQVAGQPQVVYGWDNANRLTGITQGSSAVGINYDNANRRTSLTLPNGVTVGYSVDNDSRITGLTYGAGSTQLGNLTYGYDADGRLTSKNGTLAAISLPAAVSGNTFNADNGMTGFGGATLSYDANGNLISDGTNTYTWDARNHLTAISGGTTASFVYDAFGRRVSKSIGATATQFLYDRLNPVQELQGGVPSANLLTGLRIDEYFARTDSSNDVSTLLRDALGSTIGLVGSAQSIATSNTYQPFGATTVSGATNGNSYQFTGRENDGTGLYFYRARYYSPTFQRFLNQDPIGFSGGDPNLYSYVNGNPISRIDPLGLTVVFAGDPAMQAALQAAYNTVGETELGSQLENTLETSTTVYTIANIANDNAFFDPLTNTISIDPNFHPPTSVDTGNNACTSQPAPTDAIMGHEIGHAATGVQDDGPGDMNNVDQNENPIRQQLGEPPRVVY